MGGKKMKISTTTADIANVFGDELAFRMIKEAGFDAVDYAYFENAMLDRDDYTDFAAEQKRLLEKYSLVCGQTHAPFSFRYGYKMDVGCKEYARIVRSIEMSAILGASDVVVHSIGVPDGVDEFAYNLEFYKSLIPVCERTGVRIAIENLFYSPRGERYFRGRFADPWELMALIDALDSPAFSICIDVGHAIITGRRPEDVIRGIRGDMLSVLHIHDNNSWDDTHLIPYFGSIDWDEVCAALAEIGYRGHMNSEAMLGCHGNAEVMLESLKYTGSILKILEKKVEG